MLARVIHNKKVSLINLDEIVKISYVTTARGDHKKDEMFIHYTNGTEDKLLFETPEELETILKILNPNPRRKNNHFRGPSEHPSYARGNENHPDHKDY